MILALGGVVIGLGFTLTAIWVHSWAPDIVGLLPAYFFGAVTVYFVLHVVAIHMKIRDSDQS